MKYVAQILLGASALGAIAGAAQAADLPTRKAAPAEYVKVCTAYGAGFFYIPGSDTCLKIGGVVRAEYYYRGNAPTNIPNQFAYSLNGMVYPRDTIQWRARYYLRADVRSPTEYGDLRAFTSIRFSNDSLPAGPFGGGKVAVPGLPAGAKANAGSFLGLPNEQVFIDSAYVQWAGLTAGVAHSFFDFYTHDYEIGAYSVGTSDQPLDLLAYTLKFGGGFSATISAEDPTTRRIGDSNLDIGVANNNPKNATTAAYLTYAGINAPDAVANIRYDGPWGSVQIAGALHEVNSAPIFGCSSIPKSEINCGVAAGQKDFLPVGFQPSTQWGWAFNAGGKLLFDAIGKGDSMTAQITFMRGAMDYVNAWSYWSGTSNVYDKNQSISVPANDAFVLPDGSIALAKAGGGFLGYQHFWNSEWGSNLFGSYLQIRNPTAAQLLSAGADNATVWDLGFNTFWTPKKGLTIGAEVVYTNLRLSGAFPLATGTSCPNSAAKCPVPADSDDWRGRLRIQYTF
jgi:hypothetical protein